MSQARTDSIVAKRKRRYRQPASANRRTMAIVRAYQRGDAAGAIGRRFGISANAVYQVIGRLRRKMENLAQGVDGAAEMLCHTGQKSSLPGLDNIIKALYPSKSKQHQNKFDSQKKKRSLR